MHYKVQFTKKPDKGDDYIARVSLDLEEDHLISLIFKDEIIIHLIKESFSKEETEKKLKVELTKDNNFILNKLVKLALDDEVVKEKLRSKGIGVFNVSFEKYQEILEEIEMRKEERRSKNLELLLKQNSLNL
jgi:hypothetical protein